MTYAQAHTEEILSEDDPYEACDKADACEASSSSS